MSRRVMIVLSIPRYNIEEAKTFTVEDYVDLTRQVEKDIATLLTKLHTVYPSTTLSRGDISYVIESEEELPALH